MASALHYLNLVDVFDSVYGSSAGSLAGTFFITHKMPLGPTIYYDDINNNKFIDVKRLFFGKTPIMNLDFLLYHVLENIKPMNWEKVISSAIPLKILASSIEHRRVMSFNDYRNKEELFTLLKASSTIPFIAGSPVLYKSNLLIDAALYESVPYKTAISDKCSHILCLLSRPFGRKKSKPSLFDTHLVAKKLNRLKSGLGCDYLNRAKDYNSSLDYLVLSNQQFTASPFVYSIFSKESESELSKLEKSRAKLIQGTKAGMKAVMDVFFPDQLIKYHEVVSPFNDFGHFPEIT
jgi:predicted patatin/cPLA2 family phospholipase